MAPGAIASQLSGDDQSPPKAACSERGLLTQSREPDGRCATRPNRSEGAVNLIEQGLFTVLAWWAGRFRQHGTARNETKAARS